VRRPQPKAVVPELQRSIEALLADPRRVAEVPPEARPALVLEAERRRGELAGLVRLLEAALPPVAAPARGRRPEPPGPAGADLTLAEAAALANLAPKFIRRRLKEIPGVWRPGPRTIRIPRDAFLRWRRAHQT
jgi:hypothetical protein